MTPFRLFAIRRWRAALAAARQATDAVFRTRFARWSSVAVGIAVPVVLALLVSAPGSSAPGRKAQARAGGGEAGTAAAPPAAVHEGQPVPAQATTSSTAPTTPAGSAPPAPPARTIALTRAVVSALTADGIPRTAVDAYKHAAKQANSTNPDCRLPWPLLAAIGRVESDHGRFAGAVLYSDGTSSQQILGIRLDGTRSALIRDTDNGRLDGDRVYDRAVGPMQFIPSTWAAYRADGNGDGRADPFNVFDAALAAAHYLCLAGGDLGTEKGQVRAVLAYNHSSAYLAEVLALERSYALGLGIVVPVGPAAPRPPTERPKLPPVDPGPPLGNHPRRHPSTTHPRTSHPVAPPVSSTTPTSAAPSTTSSSAPPSASSSASGTSSAPSACPSPSDTPTGSGSPTGSATATASPSPTPTPSPSPSSSSGASPTDSSSDSSSVSSSPTASPSCGR